MRQKVRGMAWQLDRKRESQEPWEVGYKKKKGGLAHASLATRKRVASIGGRSRKRRF